MNLTPSDSLVSAIVGGIVGFLGVTYQTYDARKRRRKGLCKMLAHEVQTNVHELTERGSGSPLPVRSSYLWEALRAEVAGLLNHEQVGALGDFYYRPAQVYKQEKENRTPPDVQALIAQGRKALELLGAPVT